MHEANHPETVHFCESVWDVTSLRPWLVNTFNSPGWEQIELAKRSRVAIETIRRMESFRGEKGAHTSTLSLGQATLEKAGIEFLNSGSPGVRLHNAPHKAMSR